MTRLKRFFKIWRQIYINSISALKQNDELIALLSPCVIDKKQKIFKKQFRDVKQQLLQLTYEGALKKVATSILTTSSAGEFSIHPI